METTKEKMWAGFPTDLTRKFGGGGMEPKRLARKGVEIRQSVYQLIVCRIFPLKIVAQFRAERVLHFLVAAEFD